jgi:hypothetical protein
MRGEAYRCFWWENLKKRDHLRDPGVDRTIILRWIFRKRDEGTWTGLIWLGKQTGGIFYKGGNEKSVFIKFG